MTLEIRPNIINVHRFLVVMCSESCFVALRTFEADGCTAKYK